MQHGHGFELQNVSWNYAPSRFPNSPETPVSVREFDARCNNCLHHFHADQAAADSPGHFHALLGCLTIVCPNCGQQATERNPEPFSH
jgi:hypothetical protein